LTWRRGDEPYGTFGLSSEQVAAGASAGKLTYDFPAVQDNYLVFELRPHAALEGRPSGIQAQVHGDGSGHLLNVWVDDAQGEIWAFTFGALNHQGYQLMTAPFDGQAEWPNGHISGPDNGVLDYPLKFRALVLDGIPDGRASQGQIYIDELKLADDSAPPAPTAGETSETPTTEPAQPPAAGKLSGRFLFPVFDAQRATYDIYMANADGSGLRALLGEASQPALSPDGQRFAFRYWKSDQRGLAFQNTAGGGYQRLSRFLEDALPAWSPDNKTLVFMSRRHGDRASRLYGVYATGGEDFELGGQFGEYPTWMPDGRILFRATWPSHGLAIANADGSGARTILEDGSATAPAVSPDGRYVAFMSQRDGDWEVYRIGTEGGSLRRLTTQVGRDGLPAWSPDGKTLAFLSDRDGAWAMWAMAPDGSNQRKLFTLPGPPDGVVGYEPEYSSRGWQEERVSWGP
jgi:TolB protein